MPKDVISQRTDLLHGDENLQQPHHRQHGPNHDGRDAKDLNADVRFERCFLLVDGCCVARISIMVLSDVHRHGGGARHGSYLRSDEERYGLGPPRLVVMSVAAAAAD